VSYSCPEGPNDFLCVGGFFGCFLGGCFSFVRGGLVGGVGVLVWVFLGFFFLGLLSFDSNFGHQ